MNTTPNTTTSDQPDGFGGALASASDGSAPEGEVVIETRALTKRYGVAVDDLELRVRRGEVYAFRAMHRDRSRGPSPIARRSTQAAAAWGLLFAAIHAYWALGGTGGLEGERVTGGLLVIDVIAIPLCLLATLIACAAVRPSLWPAPSWMLRAGLWVASVALGLRGLMGIAQTALGQAGDVPWGVAAADPFFLLGGILFGAVALIDRQVAARR